MTTTFKKALSVFMAAIVFVGGLFVAFNIKDISAENDAYDAVYDYRYVAGNPTDDWLRADNWATYGMYATSTSGAAGFIVNSKASATNIHDGIEINYSHLNSKKWGELTNPYVIYEVKPGTYFEADLYVKSGVNNAWTKEAVSAKTGEPFEMTLEVSSSATGGWKNKIDTSDFSATEGTLKILVPEDCAFVKITYPQTGKVENVQPGGYTVVCNDMARIMGVKYTKAPNATYDAEFSYRYVAGNATDDWLRQENLETYGMYAISTSGAAGFIVNSKASATNIHDGIEINYAHLNAKKWGELTNPYVIYEVKPGTYFEADLYVKSGTNNAWTKEAVSAKTGESFEMTIEVSSVADSGWKNKIDTSSFADTEGTLKLLVPEDCNFVKITYPQTGKVENVQPGGYTVVCNDMARIMGVRYTKAVKILYNSVYDYTYVSGNPTDGWLNSENLADYGVYSISTTGAAGFVINPKASETNIHDGIEINYAHLNAKKWGELNNPYIVYEVEPGTTFEALLYVKSGTNNAWTKEAVSAVTGEPFEMKLEVSDNPNGGWKNAVDTSSFASTEGILKIDVPTDCNFVKITYPQTGKVENVQPGGYTVVCNDMARILKVSFNAPVNYYANCETVFDYKANGPVNFFYDNDPYLIYIYQKNGISVDNFTSGATYVAPDKNYIKGTGYSKPYVVYAVEPETSFVASINVNRDIAAKLGEGFNVSIYESSDSVVWKANNTEPIVNNNVDIYSFETSEKTKYVKIEFPHTDAVKNFENANEIFGIIKVGLTPGANAYKLDPYGNYKFGTTYKFYGDPRPASFDAEALGIYEDLNPGALGYDEGADKPAYFLAYTYGKLNKKPSVEKAGMIYSVKSGTAFQVVALVARNNNLIQTIEAKLGYNWDITFEVSSDGKTWSAYNPSRILTEDHLMENTASRYATEVITIPSVPSDVKFIKVLYPQTGDMKLVTEGAFPYVGNDLIGIAQVSYTNGGAVHPSKFVPDKSEYSAHIDATEGYDPDLAPDVTGAKIIGLEFSSKLQALTPAWTYLSKESGNAVFANTGICVAVKEGSKFFVETGFTSKFLLSELDENGELIKDENGYPVTRKTVNPFEYIEGYGAKLYFSSDRMIWTDVTDKYLEVIKATDPLPIRQRFAIDNLPAGVKYVKIELPINRNMIGCPVGDEGYVTAYTGNDFCGIRRLYFNADVHVSYENKINYGSYFLKDNYGSNFPTNISDTNGKVLGLYDFTADAFELKDFTSSTLDGRIALKESYLFNKTNVESPYLVYHVKPNSPFSMSVFLSTSSRLSALPEGKLRLFVSETGKDGSWTEITNFTYIENASHSVSSYYADNLGAKTNFVKIVFPFTCDLSLDESNNAKGDTGAGFFQIRDISTNLVDFDSTWENKENIVIVHPNSQEQVVVPGEVVENPVNWIIFVIIGVGTLIVAAAVVVIILIKKKKNAAK